MKTVTERHLSHLQVVVKGNNPWPMVIGSIIHTRVSDNCRQTEHLGDMGSFSGKEDYDMRGSLLGATSRKGRKEK